MSSRWPGVFLFLALFAFDGLAAPVQRELPPGMIVPAAARPGPSFHVDRATEAYLAVLSPEQRAKSDAYFEGGYWLQLWGLIYTLAVAAFLLFGGWSRRMRERAQKISSRPWLYTMIYAAFWLVVTFVLELPLLVYQSFFREHAYGLATQTFGGWSRDAIVQLLVSLVMLPPLLALLYAAVRKTKERWWVWGSLIALATFVFGGMIAPVAIAPLFNKYESLPAGQVREEVLSLARANGVPATDVYLFDASKQTTRVSANVSGMLGTTRISLNDNLLERTSLPEIRGVMAHEMGHYVLNHTDRLVIYMTLLVAAGLWVVHRLLDAALKRWGSRWGVTDRSDPAGLPAAVAILALFMTLTSPVMNTIIRQAEAEADAFALNAAGEPHGFATVAMRLSTYRKLHPGPVEEVLFFDHPSGYARVHRSMTWLKENQNDPRVTRSLTQGR